jgi:hypothetical protein
MLVRFEWLPGVRSLGAADFSAAALACANGADTVTRTVASGPQPEQPTSPPNVSHDRFVLEMQAQSVGQAYTGVRQVTGSVMPLSGYCSFRGRPRLPGECAPTPA